MLFSASPFMSRVLIRWFGFLAVFIFAMMMSSDIDFKFFFIIALYFVFFAFKKSQNKKHTQEVLQADIKETSKFQVEANHQKLGFGYLGTTANYLYFVPNKKREEAIIINLGYLTNTASEMQATGDYVSVRDNFGSVTTKVRFPVFSCAGETPDGTEFGYAFVTDGISRASKVFDAVGKSPNGPKEVEERRKFI